jgi:branched-chain amino acid transport system ATP-binding protein
MSLAAEKAAPTNVLDVANIEVIYNHVILVLKGVSLSVPQGAIVALLGANGAGKSTTLKAISNLLLSERGQVTKGRILCRGERVDGLTPNDLVRRGVIQVMEGRHCFGHLTVEENLLTGAFIHGGKRRQIADDLEKVYHYFPRLKVRRASQAGYTSGGEQQMTAIGRALMSRPSTVLLDEPSMGSGAAARRGDLRDREEPQRAGKGLDPAGRAEHQRRACAYAHYGYILENGRVVLDGDAASLRENEDVKEFYLGVGGEGRRSFRDVKHYRRRKRWL